MPDREAVCVWRGGGGVEMEKEKNKPWSPKKGQAENKTVNS